MDPRAAVAAKGARLIRISDVTSVEVHRDDPKVESSVFVAFDVVACFPMKVDTENGCPTGITAEKCELLRRNRVTRTESQACIGGGSSGFVCLPSRPGPSP